MNAKTIYLALLALLLAIFGTAASYLISQLIAQANKRVSVLVAKQNYPQGTTITNPEKMFELREFREAELPPGVVYDYQDLRGRILTREIGEGELLVFFDLKDPNKAPTGQWMGVHEPGNQIVMVMANVRAGSIQAGSRVDVIYGDSKDASQGKTKTVHNIRVSSLGMPAAIAQKIEKGEMKEDFIQVLVGLDVSSTDAAALEKAANITLVARMQSIVIDVNPNDLLNVVPGCFVDVIQIVRKDPKKKEEKLIGKNLKVLALDQPPFKPDEKDRPPGCTATLEVTDKQAATLGKIKDQGPVILRLHSQAAVGKNGVDSEKAKNIKKVPAKEN